MSIGTEVDIGEDCSLRTVRIAVQLGNAPNFKAILRNPRPAVDMKRWQ